MKSLPLFAVVVALGLTIGTGDAEAAKCLGSNKSSGMQSQMTPPAKAPDAASVPKQSTSATAAAPAAAAAQTGLSFTDFLRSAKV